MIFRFVCIDSYFLKQESHFVAEFIFHALMGSHDILSSMKLLYLNVSAVVSCTSFGILCVFACRTHLVCNLLNVSPVLKLNFVYSRQNVVWI